MEVQVLLDPEKVRLRPINGDQRDRPIRFESQPDIVTGSAEARWIDGDAGQPDRW